MSITNTTIIDDPGGDPRYIQIDYTLHTGEVYRQRIYATGDALTAANAHAPNVLAFAEDNEIETQDEQVAAGADPLTMPDPEHGTGTLQQAKNVIWRRWLKRAYQERDPWFIKHIIPFVDWLLSQYTIAQIKAALNLSDEQWVKVRDRYLHVKNNSSVYNADQYGEL